MQSNHDTSNPQTICPLSPDIMIQSYVGQTLLRSNGNSPWVALVGGIRRSLSLGRWGHRWWVAAGWASGWRISRHGGGCLWGNSGWRGSGWGLGLCLGLLLGLLRWLLLEGGERQISEQPTTLDQCFFCFVTGCLQIQSWVQGWGRQRGPLGCSDRRGH